MSLRRAALVRGYAVRLEKGGGRWRGSSPAEPGKGTEMLAPNKRHRKTGRVSRTGASYLGDVPVGPKPLLPDPTWLHLCVILDMAFREATLSAI